MRNKFLIGKNRQLVNSQLAEQDELTHTIDLGYSGTTTTNRDNNNDYKTYDVVYIMRID